MPTLRVLPNEPQRNELKFKLLPGVPYHIRLWVVLGFWISGLAVQTAGWLLPGGALILLGTIMALTRGYSNEPARIYRKGRRWENVTLTEFRKIVSLDDESKRWDQSAWIDISNAWGFLMALLLIVAVGLAALSLARTHLYLAKLCVVDGVALFVPFWVTGIRRLYTRSEMMICVRALQNILDRLERPDFAGLLPAPMLELAKTENGDLPCDVKLMVRFDDAPDDFMGIQVQVSLNDVQGTKYPYLYCVILAKPGFGLGQWSKPPTLQTTKITTERKTTREVEILVVRQTTTKKSGYHTNKAAQIHVFETAVAVCRRNLPSGS